MESTPSVPIEILEKFQALQAHIVYVAAQQIKGKVERVARQRNNNENNDVAGNGRQCIKHLGNDRAGQHQRH